MEVRVGSWRADLVTCETNAPRSYDGFGTIELRADGKRRVVLIEREHMEWHRNRYGSGLHSLAVLEGLDDWAQAKLVDRLTGRDRT